MNQVISKAPGRVCLFGDHQDYLGNSLSQIAFEKLGILNSKSINIINKQKPQVMKFIKDQLNKRKLEAQIFNQDWTIRSDIYFSKQVKINLSKLSLLGKHQKFNAGLAIHLAKNILNIIHCLLKWMDTSARKL